MGRTLLPQEVETYYIIPTIRRYFAQFLKETGMKQVEIAKIFNVKTATISQYINTKRGHQINFDKETIKEIKSTIPRIKDTLSYLKETQHLLKFMRKTHALCTIHKHLSTVPEGCEPETVGCHHEH
ncbi:hypothetical protein HOI26_04725 [Candidatus Woesearchaeota archaeon]|jgi:predicted transcriptional regulator|nr:hypothetical protein [Candidatus Woesearchaeota archaeon]MBT5740374.1 hypothetical protein [Candidatus Woesearchaeota archaeon]